jgi:hypothetical protein
MTKIGSAGKHREPRADRTDRDSREVIDREQNALRAKTARLRAERLQMEEAAAKAKAEAAPAKPKARKAKAPK